MEARQPNSMERLIACRECSVPIVSISTADEWATTANIAKVFTESPILRWTCVDGFSAHNESGTIALGKLGDMQGMDSDPTFALGAALKLPPKSTVIMIGAHRFCGKDGPEESLKKLRDEFKRDERMVILLGPSFKWGPDIGPHMEAIEEQMPSEEDRDSILSSLYEAAEAKRPDADTHHLGIAMTRGLCAFGVEQAASLAMRPTGIDLVELRDRWRQKINSTQGLSLDDTERSIDALGGLRAIKEYASLLKTSREPVSAVILLDEGGKALAGGGAATGGVGDTSGVSQGIEASLLAEMDMTKADGMIAFGVPGSGKTASAQAIAACLRVPIIRLDLNAVKGSLVGESERNTHIAFNVLRALVGERAFWILTCNELVTIKTEIKRRFRSGTWFYDVPNVDERNAIINIYAAKYNIPLDEEWPDMTEWTGAEIETCCERSWRFNIPIIQAARWIVPVTVMASETVDSMRKAANGRFLAASYPGKYTIGGQPSVASQARKFFRNPPRPLDADSRPGDCMEPK